MKTLIRLSILFALMASVSACASREKVDLVIIGNPFGSNNIPQVYQAAVDPLANGGKPDIRRSMGYDYSIP